VVAASWPDIPAAASGAQHSAARCVSDNSLTLIGHSPFFIDVHRSSQAGA
jgi:hypothetical protein